MSDIFPEHRPYYYLITGTNNRFLPPPVRSERQFFLTAIPVTVRYTAFLHLVGSAFVAAAFSSIYVRPTIFGRFTLRTYPLVHVYSQVDVNLCGLVPLLTRVSFLHSFLSTVTTSSCPEILDCITLIIVHAKFVDTGTIPK